MCYRKRASKYSVFRRLHMLNEPKGAKLNRRVVTVGEAAAILHISRGAAYQAAKTKQLPTIRIGRRLLVPLAGLERMLTEGADDDRGSLTKAA
jgi:excisionase family DNA binding protein